MPVNAVIENPTNIQSNEQQSYTSVEKNSCHLRSEDNYAEYKSNIDDHQ